MGHDADLTDQLGYLVQLKHSKKRTNKQKAVPQTFNDDSPSTLVFVSGIAEHSVNCAFIYIRP